VLRACEDGVIPRNTSKRLKQELEQEINPLKALAIFRNNIPPVLLTGGQAPQGGELHPRAFAGGLGRCGQKSGSAMNLQEARRLVRETFQNVFDEDRFRLFVRNLFPDLDESGAFAYQGQYIPDAYKEHIRLYQRLGKYTDPDGKALDVLVVNLKREAALDRARTMQRNFIAWYLKHRGEKDAALVAYHTDGREEWRFSFVRMDYRTMQDETGKVRVKTDLTPARRYSFLVGRDENSHTAQTRFQPFLEDDRDRPTLAQLEEAFSIERVTKEFFEKYRLLLNDLHDALDDITAHDAVVGRDFAAKGVETVNFAKKTLGQIVFLYILQKKGWFGVARDQAWGTGPKNFLRRLFEERKYANFFNDILEPLFYEALARERCPASINYRARTKNPCRTRQPRRPGPGSGN
jgi:hypothetical protein